MVGADWAFWVAVATLGYLALLAVELTRAIWEDRPPRLTRATMTVALVLIVASVMSLPRSSGELTLVASVASGASGAADADALQEVLVSGCRVRLAGRGLESEEGIWAVIHDPRTERRWLQGPALQDGSRWSLDLVVGLDAAVPDRLPYRVSVLSVPPEVSASWLAAAQHGPLLLPTTPTGHVWLARDREVIIGG